MKTYQPKKKEVKREWHLIDADGQVLGRMATGISKLLMGKHKPKYASHIDMGDYVVVLNASKVELTGRKKDQKVYRGHSGYPGGFKEVSFQKMIQEHPERVIEKAVSGMLPGNRLKQNRMRRLLVSADKRNPYRSKFEKKEEKKK